MSNNLYITAMEPRSGKSVVLLGIMEMLSRRIRQVGFFRPVVRASPELDNDIQLVISRYNPELSYKETYGYAHEEAQNLVAAGQYNELLKNIVSKYKALESQCRFVLCEGTDFTGVSSAFEFDFNADVANNLGAPILAVVNGLGKSTDEVVDSARVARESFEGHGCTLAAIVVNRVKADKVESIAADLRGLKPEAEPLYVVPEESTLGKPTVGEIARALNAKILQGEPNELNREVRDFKVAAMNLPNFLDYVVDDALIITPGDRSDVILGSLATAFSETYPNIAGILLTGGLTPEPQVQRLIEGVKKSSTPIISVDTDTYNTAMDVSEVPAVITPDNERKVATALGLFESSVNLDELGDRITGVRSIRVTPIMFEYQLIERAKSKRQHIVLPEGDEERLLRASEVLLRRNVCDITLLGNEEEIQQKIGTLGLDLEGVKIVDPVSSEWLANFAKTYYQLRKHKGISEEMAADAMTDVSYFGTMMVHKGTADGMVSGAVHTTAHTIRPSFEIIKTKPGCSIVSSVFLMCLADRVLVYGDCAVNPNPNSEQLADIAISSAGTAGMFGIDPRIAMLSYSTGESGKGEAVEAVREATAIAKERRPDLKIEGPIQYDAAVDASVAKTKLPESEVAGHATVFIFPDLNTGNNTYKAVQRSANAVAIGPVLQGLNKPVNDLSRGALVVDIVNTVAITAIQAQES
ncbi:MAG: phosphate acetyltransferase [Deltaproteobacteria bacterium]|nr:MAG: phosphate acetyltransferase [Deltaproteobacteria bacterium]